MAGIYIHIPFCRKKCYYCDFFSVASQKKRASFLDALMAEITLRREYLHDKSIETIYFGGGTPSLLMTDEIAWILNTLQETYTIVDNAEITLEANPEDLSLSYLKQLRDMGINRLSIGVQSLHDEHLVFLGRCHSAEQAMSALQMAKEAGFTNVSADLMYGIPGQTVEQWTTSIKRIIDANIQHISAYHLTIEEKTILGNRLHKGELLPVAEETGAEHYSLLCSMMQWAGFVHYEISNFALPNFFSRHNANYWRQYEYLGLGPSAHSYNTVSRQWNNASLDEYCSILSEGKLSYTVETIDKNTAFNEYMMLSLRTAWGADMMYIEKNFGKARRKAVEQVIARCNPKYFVLQKENVLLTEEAWFISDAIITDFLWGNSC